MANSSINKNPHFFIGGYLGWDNLGDELILWQIVKDLKNLAPECEITVWTQNPQFTHQWVKTKTIEYSNVKELFKTIKESITHVIVGGGGLIQDYFSLSLQEMFSEFKPRPENYLLPALAGKYYGKPVFFWSQGLGPLHSEEGQRFAKLFLALADSGTFRDQESYLLADRLIGPYHNFYIDADPVTSINLDSLLNKFGLDIGNADRSNYLDSNRPLIIGVNIRPFMKLEDTAIRMIHDIIQKILAITNRKIIILPIPFDFREDTTILKSIANVINFPNITIDNSSIEKPSFKNTLMNILRCNLFIGMRLHSIILAWKLNIPVIGLSYDPKVSNFCRRYNIPVIQLSDPEPLHIDLIKNLLNTKSINSEEHKPQYLTPTIFKDFLAQENRLNTLSLSDIINLRTKYYSLVSQYNDIVNSKAYRLVSQYYKIANWIKKFFLSLPAYFEHF